MDPKIYLAIDNCFASKRWTQPREWMRVIRELGLTGVEASADTECDPLYMGAEFTRDWIEDVKRQCAQTGCVVRNVYSGHGTYATSGLSHYDRRVTERFRDAWMKAQMDTGDRLNPSCQRATAGRCGASPGGRWSSPPHTPIPDRTGRSAAVCRPYRPR